jgi:hypothetical protein
LATAFPEFASPGDIVAVVRYRTWERSRLILTRLPTAIAIESLDARDDVAVNSSLRLAVRLHDLLLAYG